MSTPAIRFPAGFLWGAATSAHQTEGSSTNSDWWQKEHAPGTFCTEPSGDACDSFHRYPEDIAIVAELGLNSYRFSLEWSRLEPAPGEYSVAARDHYGRMVDACLARGLRPSVTIQHFTIPRWLDAQGGWLAPHAAGRFLRLVEFVAPILREVPYVCTINEPNVAASFARLAPGLTFQGAELPDPDPAISDVLTAAHRGAVAMIRSWHGPRAGWAVATQGFEALPGAEDRVEKHAFERQTRFLLDAADDDWLGVQAYTRTRVGPDGPVPPPPGHRLTQMGWEYWPDAASAGLVEAAARAPGVPLIVTENGIATDDDTLRESYVRDALVGVARAIADGLPVLGYYYWSLLDNFEWAAGYRPTFGLVAVDRGTFRRTVKPSGRWYGGIARRNALVGLARPIDLRRPEGTPMSAQELTVLSSADGHSVEVVVAGHRLTVPGAQVAASTTSGARAAEGYTSIEDDRGVLEARADLALDDGTLVQVRDRWEPSAEGDGALVTRSVEIVRSGDSAGVRTELLLTPGLSSDDAEWQFFVCGALYNRNDTDLDGREDYLGGHVQEYRDDRNGHLAVMAYSPQLQAGVSLARATPPTWDSAISPAQLESGVVVQSTDVGSLGVVFRPSEPLVLRAGYPFGEERSFALETSGRGWAGFLPNEPGTRHTVVYELWLVQAEDLTEAIWDVTRRQRERLRATPPELPLPLEELEAHRFMLTQQYFRSWRTEEDPRRPAGYLTHFSPRRGETQGSLIEFGFTGAQSLHALNAIRRSHRERVPLWAFRAREVIDFFVREFQHANGYSDGIYDTFGQRFVPWFTGILLPFQYSDDDAHVRRYLGSQITDALGPIARELRAVEGNYLRTMCESVYPILLAYEEELRHGVVHDEWLAAGERLGAFLLGAQGSDGSWHRAYAPDGRGLTEPAAWFGASDVERHSGTIFPIEVLAVLHRVTGKEEYRTAALRAAHYIAETYVPGVLYCGGLNDTTHIKSVKIDAVAVMFAMRSLIMAYHLGRDDVHLAAAVKAAKVLTSWLFLWDVPFPEGSLLHTGGFRTTGWAVCDAIPGGGYVDDELLEFVADVLDVALESGEHELVDYVELALHGMQHGLSIPSNMLGYAAPGIQCEGYLTSYWLSAPESTAFSGAVGKVKGDDNDTCNGLINAQALYGLDDMRERFGTIELAEIRDRCVGVERGR